MARKIISIFIKSKRKKRPGRHSKNLSLSQRKKKYIGQGNNMETLKHILGICGESHPNLYTIIFLVFIILIFLKKKKIEIKIISIYLRNSCNLYKLLNFG